MTICDAHSLWLSRGRFAKKKAFQCMHDVCQIKMKWLFTRRNPVPEKIGFLLAFSIDSFLFR